MNARPPERLFSGALLLLSALVPSAALAQSAPESETGDAVADAPVTLSDDETSAFDSAFGRFQARMNELSSDVRGIVDQREGEERSKIVRSYKAVQEQLETEEEDLRTVAIRRFEEFLQRHPGADYTPHVTFRLAELYFEQSGEDWLAARDDYEALDQKVIDGEMSLEDLPEIPLKNYQRSMDLYKQIIEAYPDYEYADAAYYMLGYCSFDDLSEQMDLQQAKGWFQGLIDYHPDSDFAIEANLLLGTVYFDDNDIEESIPYFKEVVDAGVEQSRYDKGLYQLAWAHYKLSHYEESLQLFTDLLDFSDEQFGRTGKISNMKPEALKYLAISFSDIADRDNRAPIDVAHDWFGQVGTREYEPEVIKELAEVLVIQARYEQAIVTYAYIQEQWPLAPENPVNQNTIAQLYGQLPLPDYEASAHASAVLSERYGPGTDWWEANRANPDAQATARKFIEDSLSKVARSKHQAAIQSQAAGDYLAAAALYQEYLQKFPFANDYYELTWYLADTLYRAGEYQQAVGYYSQLLKFPDKHAYTDGARYQIWRSWRSLLEDTYSDVYTRPDDAVVERTEETADGGQRELYLLSEAHQGYIAISDDLRAREFSESNYSQALERDRATLYYDPAYILFQYGRYEEARPRLEEVIAKFPNKKECSLAAGAIVTSYQNDGDLVNVLKYAAMYRNMACGPAVDGMAEVDENDFGTIEEGAAYKLALQLGEGGESLEAAAAFLAFTEKYPSSQYINNALYSVGYYYQQAGKNNEANRYYERYINQYPNDDRSKSLYFRIASNYSGVLELDKAVEYYEQLYRNFPDYIDGPAALYNAAFLRVGMGDYRGAAADFETYAARSTDAKESEQVTWLAGEQWQRVGDSEALSFYQGYLREYPSANPDHLIESLDWIASYYDGRGQDVQADRTRDQLLDAYAKLDEAGAEIGPRGRNIAAGLAFADLWQEYQDFKVINFTADENANSTLLVETKAKDLVALIDNGRAIIRTYLDFEYTSAALFVEGAAHLEYAEMFFNAPVPDSWTMDQVDFYRSVLDDKARPLEDKGVARLEASLEKAAAEKRSSEWIDRTISKLNEYRPKDYPLEKPEVRGTMQPSVIPQAGPRSLSEVPAATPTDGAPTDGNPAWGGGQQ